MNAVGHSHATDEVLYRYEHGNLIPYIPVSLPVDCLKRVYLEDFRRRPLLFGTLNGFLKSKDFHEQLR